jgi:hypothetical protein
MKYFRKEEDQTARLPKNFIEGFLEVHNYLRLFDFQLTITGPELRDGPTKPRQTILYIARKFQVVLYRRNASIITSCRFRSSLYRHICRLRDKLVSRICELLCDDVACRHQILQPFPQCIKGGRFRIL